MNIFESYIASLPPSRSADAYDDNGWITAHEYEDSSERYLIQEMSCTLQNVFVTRNFTADELGPDYGALVWIAKEGHLGIIFGNRRDCSFRKELRQELATAVFFHAETARPNQGMPASGSPDIGDDLIRLTWAEVCALILKYRPSIHLNSIAIEEAR